MSSNASRSAPGLTRRAALVGAGAALALAGPTGRRSAVAQDATPAAPATPAATTDLAVTLTADGFADLPAELAAGRYRVAFTNESADPAAFILVQIPAGESLDDLAAGVAAAMDVMAGFVPPAAGGANPMTGLAWLNRTGLSGGPGAGPGETGVATIDLAPGEWAVADDFDLRSLRGAPTVTVTGATALVDAAAPAADVTLLETGHGGEGFAFAPQGALRAGARTIEIVNASDQPHFVEIVRLPGPTTADELLQVFTADPAASPEPGMPDPKEFVLAAYASAQSVGTRQWLEVDLAPGTYSIACWIPDPLAGGLPHALEGMITVVDIGGDVPATPAA